MPVMGGCAAASELRSRGFPNLIIGVTGDAFLEDVDAFVLAGAGNTMI